MPVAFTVVVVAMTIGVFMFQQKSQPADLSNGDDFNFAAVMPGQTSSVIAAAALRPPDSAPPTPASGLNMVRSGLSGIKGPPSASHARAATRQSFAEAIRSDESALRALGREYTARFAVIRQWRQDWRSYPDLSRFRDEFNSNHDPLRFIHHVAGSPNFAAMVKQYANKPELLSFIQEAAKTGSSELLTSAQEYLRSDGNMTALVDKFAVALGLPASMIGGLAGKTNVDPNQIMADMMKSNPQLQSLMQNAGSVSVNSIPESNQTQRGPGERK